MKSIIKGRKTVVTHVVKEIVVLIWNPIIADNVYFYPCFQVAMNAINVSTDMMLQFANGKNN